LISISVRTDNVRINNVRISETDGRGISGSGNNISAIYATSDGKATIFGWGGTCTTMTDDRCKG
jgi:hypothetical protein